MSEQLNPCSICKSPVEKVWDLQEEVVRCTNRTCHNSLYSMYLNEWQKRPIEDELQARIKELEAENAALKEYRDGHDPKVDFPPEGVWVNMRDCDGNFSPMQYDHNVGWYWNYAVNYDGDSFSYWYPDNSDLVRWYPIPPLSDPQEVE